MRGRPRLRFAQYLGKGKKCKGKREEPGGENKQRADKFARNSGFQSHLRVFGECPSSGRGTGGGKNDRGIRQKGFSRQGPAIE